MRIPLGIIGQVAGMASFPFLARLWSQKEYGEYSITLLRELKKLWAVGPLAAIVLVNHALPATHFIYGGGRLSAADLSATAGALRMFGYGLVAWLLQTLISRGFYASQKTWLPSLLGTVLSVVAIPLYAILGARWGHEGLAAAGSVGITVYTLLLWGLLTMHMRRHVPSLSFGPFYRFLATWGIVVCGCYGLSRAIASLGIYRGTVFSGLLETACATVCLVGIGFFALRRLFSRMTDGPLL